MKEFFDWTKTIFPAGTTIVYSGRLAPKNIEWDAEEKQLTVSSHADNCNVEALRTRIRRTP